MVGHASTRIFNNRHWLASQGNDLKYIGKFTNPDTRFQHIDIYCWSLDSESTLFISCNHDRSFNSFSSDNANLNITLVTVNWASRSRDLVFWYFSFDTDEPRPTIQIHLHSIGMVKQLHRTLKTYHMIPPDSHVRPRKNTLSGFIWRGP